MEGIFSLLGWILSNYLNGSGIFKNVKCIQLKVNEDKVHMGTIMNIVEIHQHIYFNWTTFICNFISKTLLAGVFSMERPPVCLE